MLDAILLRRRETLAEDAARRPHLAAHVRRLRRLEAVAGVADRVRAVEIDVELLLQAVERRTLLRDARRAVLLPRRVVGARARAVLDARLPVAVLARPDTAVSVLLVELVAAVLGLVERHALARAVARADAVVVIAVVPVAVVVAVGVGVLDVRLLTHLILHLLVAVPSQPPSTGDGALGAGVTGGGNGGGEGRATMCPARTAATATAATARRSRRHRRRRRVGLDAGRAVLLPRRVVGARARARLAVGGAILAGPNPVVGVLLVELVAAVLELVERHALARAVARADAVVVVAVVAIVVVVAVGVGVLHVRLLPHIVLHLLVAVLVPAAVNRRRGDRRRAQAGRPRHRSRPSSSAAAPAACTNALID